MTSSAQFLLSVALATLAASSLGCSGGGDRPKTYAVSGQVAYKGQPVEGAAVAFWAENAPRGAQGTTDKDGKFTLSTYELNDGAFPGKNKVTVSKVSAEAAAASGPPPTNPADMSKMYRDTVKKMANQKGALPVKYSKPESTTLEADVKAGSNDPFVFTLTD